MIDWLADFAYSVALQLRQCAKTIRRGKKKVIASQTGRLC